MDDRKTASKQSAGWYFLGGLAVGTAAGLLLAPKKGSEIREDIEEWSQRAREKAEELVGS